MAKKKILTLDEQLSEENNIVTDLISFYSNLHDYDFVIYEDWTAKDVLGHITSWHMSFQRNLKSAMKNERPNPFKRSLTDVNEREVVFMKQFSIAELIEKLKNAQTIIGNNIKNENIKEIAYKKGSRDYSPIEHLEIVRRHISTHLDDVKKKWKDYQRIE